MKTPRLSIAAAFVAGLVLPFAAQAAEPAKGIPGFLDPSAGAFAARPALVPALAPLFRTGTIVVTTTVVIDSAIPVDQPIECQVFLSSSDASFFNTAFGTNNVVRSSSSGKCTTTINFIWKVASASTNMNVSVFVSTGNFGTPSVSHSASTSFAPFPVPAGTKSLAVSLAL